MPDDRVHNMELAVERTQSEGELENHLDFWSKRYVREGHIWGDEPSLTADRLIDVLHPDSKVLEIGFGYGRDLVHMLNEGHRVYGIEKAAIGLSEATRQVQQYLDAGKGHLMLGEFNNADLKQESFDAVVSHRVLHLLGSNGLTTAFANRAAGVLKPGGLLYVSARDTRDFNDTQMKWVGDNIAEYKNRGPGQQISFWDRERFNRVFGKKFDIIGFEEATEIESTTNPVNSHFTIMMARKKTEFSPS